MSENMVELTPAQYKVAGIELGSIEQRNLSEGAAAFDDLNNGRTAAAKIILNCEIAG